MYYSLNLLATKNNCKYITTTIQARKVFFPDASSKKVSWIDSTCIHAASSQQRKNVSLKPTVCKSLSMLCYKAPTTTNIPRQHGYIAAEKVLDLLFLFLVVTSWNQTGPDLCVEHQTAKWAEARKRIRCQRRSPDFWRWRRFSASKVRKVVMRREKRAS